MLTLSSPVDLIEHRADLREKTEGELISYLTESLGLSGIDVSPKYAGYWLLERGNSMAIFSLRSNSLIRLPEGDEDDVYFRKNIALLPIILPGVMHEVFVSVGGAIDESGDMINIEVFGKIIGDRMESINGTPNGVSMRTAVSLYVTRLITRYRTIAALELAPDEKEFTGAMIALLEEVEKRLTLSNNQQ